MSREAPRHCTQCGEEPRDRQRYPLEERKGGEWLCKRCMDSLGQQDKPDKQLIAQVEQLAKCTQWVKAHERESIADMIEDYIAAFDVAKWQNPQRKALWRKRAKERAYKLKQVYRTLTGADYDDTTSFRTSRKCEEA